MSAVMTMLRGVARLAIQSSASSNPERAVADDLHRDVVAQRDLVDFVFNRAGIGVDEDCDH
jgi:hypothetical protein